MSNNIISRGQPSRTALRVATARAAHRLLDDPVVLDDPLALTILGPEAEAELRADPYAHNDRFSRGLRAALVVRSRVAEDEVARAVRAGIRQYVVLGAGLDTFAYRNPHRAAGLRVFEVDHPSTQVWKRECLASQGIPVPGELTFAPVDFERDTLAHGLAKAGFDFAQPACFSWLGVTMYLTEAAVFETLRFIAGLSMGSSVVFDYRVPLDRLSPEERFVTEQMMKRVAEMGEPWVSMFDPEQLQRRMLEIGFSRAHGYEPDELNRKYLDQRNDGLRTRSRIMCAWL